MPAAIDYDALLAPGLPPPAPRWNGFAPYNFIGGNVDAASMPVEDMIAATASALRREGTTLATYGLDSGPLGYRPLREFVAAKLRKRSGLSVSPDNVLITSGSNQGLDLVNEIFLCPGDTVLVEQFSYGSALARLRKLGVRPVGIPLDDDGMRMDRLAETLAALAVGRREAEIHLCHPDDPEPRRQHHAGSQAGRAAAPLGGIRRARLRGRVLCRPAVDGRGARPPSRRWTRATG